MKGMKG
ncbi:hypothetical protein CP8484711_1571A, partial [Chlamydia psittaci 84-8471/1]